MRVRGAGGDEAGQTPFQERVFVSDSLFPNSSRSVVWRLWFDPATLWQSQNGNKGGVCKKYTFAAGREASIQLTKKMQRFTIGRSIARKADFLHAKRVNSVSKVVFSSQDVPSRLVFCLLGLIEMCVESTPVSRGIGFY